MNCLRLLECWVHGFESQLRHGYLCVRLLSFCVVLCVGMSRDSAVDIATGYGLDDRGVGVRVPVESRILSSPRRPDRLWSSTQPPIQWLPGVPSPGVKRQGSEVDNSPPASAEVKKIWIYTSTPTYAFMA
jgi:hypothetical protein